MRRPARSGGKKPVPSKTILIVIVLVVVAELLSLSVVNFFGDSRSAIQVAAVAATNTNAGIEAHDMATIFSSKVGAISSNLALLSGDASIAGPNASAADPLLAAAQDVTKGFTTGYVFVNSRGELVASSNLTAPIIGGLQAGVLNFSQQGWFRGARTMGSLFVDPASFSGALNRTYTVISEPVYRGTGGPGNETFVGVLASGVSLHGLGRLIESQLPQPTQGSVWIVGDNGTILYSGAGGFAGENISTRAFRSAMASQLPGIASSEFYSFVNDSLSGRPASGDYIANGLTTALSSVPVSYGQVLGNSTDSRTFALVYVMTPSTLAAGEAAEIAHLQTLTALAIVGITGTAVVGSWEAVRRNRALNELVKKRTSDLEKSLKSSELMQDILTHDIRNYNQISLLKIGLLKEELAEEGRYLDRNKVIGLADSALDAIDGSTMLVDKAKFLGKVVSEGDVRLRPTDLEDSLRGAIRVVASANPGRALKVSLMVPSHPQVMADDLLEEVFANLLSNSIKYTEGVEVPVVVSVEPAAIEGGDGPPRDCWKATLSDRGRGVADDLKQELFARYLKTAQGTGLGLSIVYALVVKRYSGEVKVSDRVEGDYRQGTKVEIWLPKAP